MINFIKYKLYYFLFSLLFLIPGTISLVLYGLKPAIDFTGGALIEVKFGSKEGIKSNQVEEKIRELEGVDISLVQDVKDNSNFIIKLNYIDENKKNEVVSKLKDLNEDIVEVRFETVGPVLGRELLIKTGVAVFVISLIILFYIAYQFKDRVFGIASVLAMFHDTLILLGIFSILGKVFNIEVDTLFVTALLTTLSFSVHDTIVVFDRIRELLNKNQAKSMEEAINKSINQTLVRSLNNSMTIIFMLTALFLLGGETTKFFVLALLIGTVSGTYSSTFTASPLLLVLKTVFKPKPDSKVG